MNNTEKAMVKAIDIVLGEWEKLDDWHKGKSYISALESLKKLKSKIESGENQ